MKQSIYLLAVMLAALVTGIAVGGEAPPSDAAVLKSIEADPKSDASFTALNRLMETLMQRAFAQGGTTAQLSDEDQTLMHRLAELLVRNDADRPEAANTALMYLFTQPPAVQTEFMHRMYEAATSVEARSQIAPSLVNFYEHRYHSYETPAAERAQLRKDLTGFVARIHKDLAGGDAYFLERADKAVTALDYSIGDKLPDLHVPTVDGGAADLAQQRGKIVIVDLWATWCAPCVAGQPTLVELKKEFQGKPFEVFSLSMDKKPADVLKHMEKQPMPWINGYVGFQPPQVKQWGISGFPGLFVLDADGVIRMRPGELDEKAKEHLRTLVASLEAAQKRPK